MRPPGGTVTKVLCGLLLVFSLIGAFAQRSTWGFGVDDLNFQVNRVLSLEVWRLFTYPFVESSPFNLLMSLVILWLFGGWFESRWGGRDFLRFFILSSVGAAVLAIPLSFAVDWLLPFRDVGTSSGPGAALDAMLVALALTSPDSNVLFGFVLPVRTRTLVLLLLGFQVISGIMTGAATLSITLGGMGMGYVLVTGSWRPSQLLHKLRSLRHYRVRRRSGLYVVPPRDKTLH